MGQIAAIHDAAPSVFRDTSMRVLDPVVRQLYAQAGAQVADVRIKLDPATRTE